MSNVGGDPVTQLIFNVDHSLVTQQIHGEFPRNHCWKCLVAHSGESFRNTFYNMHFTIGSSKTRQITIQGLGLNTTNYDMRPIGNATLVNTSQTERDDLIRASISRIHNEP